MRPPLLLLTNDDGVQAPGLRALAAALAELGRVVVVAPERDNSAIGHALTMRRPLRVERLAEDWYAVNGTPADCVVLALEKLLAEQRPALVASGINPGPNIGDDINYSGTVSAAMEATMLGIPALSFSLAGEPPHDYRPAARFARCLAFYVLEHGLPADTLLNVNYPALEPPRGVRLTRQGRRIYTGAVKETCDPLGRPHYWIGGGVASVDQRHDTDGATVEEGYVSITPLHFDFTNYQALERLRQQLAFPQSAAGELVVESSLPVGPRPGAEDQGEGNGEEGG